MKRFLSFVVLIFCILSVTSCDTSGKSAIAFRELPFCAEVKWSSDGTEYCAKIYSRPSQKLHISDIDAAIVGAEGDRYAEYVLPAALEGVRVEKSGDGEYKASLGGACVSSIGIADLALPLELIFTDGKAKPLGKATAGGAICDTYSLTDELGTLKYYLDHSTAFPRRIERDGVTLDFVWVEIMN